jgi:hypothetical protein
VFICAEELQGIISLPTANFSDCKHSFLRKNRLKPLEEKPFCLTILSQWYTIENRISSMP